MNGDEDLEFGSGRQKRYRQGGIPALAPFAAGQIVTADDYNELVDALKELDLRLKALERR
jgi:hypothetical protein